MSRDVTAAFSTALGASVVAPILLFEGVFSTGTVRLWTGHGDLTWDSKLWVGGGTLLGIAPVEETTDVVASGSSVSLSGVPSDLVQIAIEEARQGLPGRIWLGLLNDAGEVIVDPARAFTGRLDVPQITADGSSTRITITYESRLIDLNRPRELRYTDQSQQSLYPGDLGFEYVAGLQEAEVVWGRS